MTTEQPAEPYKILHLIPGLGFGGAEHQLLRNLSLMDSTRFQNTVCHIYPRTALAGDLRDAGIEVTSIETTGAFKTFRMVRKLRRTIREKGIDLVHASNAEAGIVGGLAARFSGIPIVTTLNGSAYGDEWLVDNPSLNRLKLKYMKTSRWASLRFLSSHSIAVSNFVKDDFHRALRVPEEKIDVVPRGVNDDFFEPDQSQVDQTRAELVPGGSFPVLLNVGRLIPAKGQRYLLDAMPRIIERYPNALLLIVGAGHLEKTLKETVRKLGIESNVTFTGARRDIRALQELADVFAFPSLHEGMPGALLEAMASANPCLASSSGPMPELIENEVSGLLVEPRSSEGVSQAVIRLAEDPELRERLGSAARERVWTTYRLVKSAGDTAGVFEKVISLSRAKKGRSALATPFSIDAARNSDQVSDQPEEKA